MRKLKKWSALVVTICFMLSIANLPAYSDSAYTRLDPIPNIISIQNQEEYNLQPNFVTINSLTVKPKVTKNITKAQVKKKANQNLALINSLLKKKGVSSLSKKWLKKSKTLINKNLNSKKSNATKYAWLSKALTAIKSISKAKGAVLTIIKQTVASGSVFSSLKSVLKKNAAYKIYANYTAKIISSINKLLKKKNVNSTVKTWLKKAKTLVNNKMFGKKSNSYKKNWLKKALTAINKISKENASILSVVKETATAGSVFSSLKSVLKNNAVYKIYVNYTLKINNLIDSFLKKSGISSTAKTWLNKAKSLVNSQMEGASSNSAKEAWLKKALTSINNVINKNASMEVLEQESKNDSVFASFQQTVLEPSEEYQKYQTDKIIEVYSEKCLAVISKLSEKTGFSKNDISQQFIKAGVTKEQFETIADTLLNKINSGANFVNNSAVALSKVFNINEKLIAVQQLAVAIAKGSNVDSNSSLENQLAVAKMNGKTDADIYTDCSIDDLLSGLKVGEGVVLQVYNGNSFISVVKQNADSFMVVDKDFYDYGEILNCLYTANEFKKLMNYEIASFTFKLKDGRGGYGNRSANYGAKNAEGNVIFLSNSSGMKEREDNKLNEQYVQPAIMSINNLLAAEGTSQIAKTWLNKAKEIVNGIIKNNNMVSNEKEQLKQVKKSIQKIVEQNASVAVLLQETSSTEVFSSLQEQVLNKDENIKNIIYPIFIQYAKPAAATINNLLKNNDGESAQVWLNAAYDSIGTVINEIVDILNSGDGDYSAQQQWLQRAAESIETVKNGNVSMTVLDQETQGGAAFAQLRETLENTTTFQAYRIFEEIGAKVVSTLAKYINVLENVVFQQFVRYNVTANSFMSQTGRDNLNVGELLLDQIQKGINFFNCASIAVSKYLDISRTFAGLQNLAADIALGYYGNVNGNEYSLVSTTNVAEMEVLKQNGIQNVTDYNYVFSIENFISNLPIGAKTLFHVECFDGAGHAIMVSKEGTDSFGVCDINLNNGSKVIYTALEFKQLMNAEVTSITGKDAITGADITRNIYYKATNDYGKISFITSSENVEEMLRIAA